MNYFTKRWMKTLVTCLVVMVAFALGTNHLRVDWVGVIVNFKNAITYFMYDYFPIDFSELLPQLAGLWETVLVSISGTVTGSVLAFFAALMISVKTSPNKYVKIVFRVIASICRNIPEGVWAIILLLSFWFGNFLAYLVITIISFGFLTRVFADTIDEANASAIEALQATGANQWQIIQHAVIPEALPLLISWILYSIENNIRSATIVGMLSGSGIGYLMGIYKGFMRYRLMMSSILLVTVLIIGTDYISTLIRRKILS